MSTKLFSKTFLLGLAFIISGTVFCQKKPLDHSVYDSWKSLSNIQISDEGKFTAAIINEQEGDACLFVKNIESSKEIYIPRAYKYSITPDQQYIIAQIKAPFKTIREAKIKKTPEEKMPKDSLAILFLPDFSITKISSVKDYKIGKDYSDYVVYTLADTVKVKNNKDTKTYRLIIRNLYTAKEDTIKNVAEYIFSRNGKNFSANTIPAQKDSISKPSVIFIDLDNNTKKTVSEGETIYKNLSLSESGDKLAFLATSDSLKKEVKDYKLFIYDKNKNSTELVADKNKRGMPEKWNVSENYTPVFSKNEKRLLLGTAPIPTPKDTTIPDFEKAQLDIWHWQEPEIQPMQWAELKRKQKQTYLAFVDLENGNNFYQLANEEIPDVRISDENNGRYAMGLSNLNSRFEIQWDLRARTTYDVWVFDLENNSKKLIKEKLPSVIRLSPSGKYIAWYDFIDRQYHTYSTETGKEYDLTSQLKVNFWDEKYDQPSLPDPYGFGDWMENDEAFIVYDAYDLWKLDPNGKNKPQNITHNKGREQEIRLRYKKTDPESRFIKKDETLLLTAFDTNTKEHGFYTLNKNKLQQLTMEKFSFPDVVKAKNINALAFIKSNFNTSPDLYYTLNEWKSETKMTDINPQMREYSWGTVELISWTTFDNKQTQGLLYKPENFDPQKKYPVLIYFYEKHTDNLYQYMPPSPSRSTINIPFYCSRGYVVFTPDIQYTTGHPGESAYNSVVSGAEMLAENAWVDKNNMGIQGQSWGGYQVAYLVTRTNMFKAAGAGAPVSNMFSAYGGIRWESGRSRQYQYEQTQSRLGATMWEAPELYKENSPIFFADKVETPLLIMHNDKDGAVPWYQGIEYFMALRRLGKPVWLLQYNNEAHNLLEMRNRKDLSIRLQQFFDHYLKGDPMPIWMKTGVPASEKGQNYGFDF